MHPYNQPHEHEHEHDHDHHDVHGHHDHDDGDGDDHCFLLHLTSFEYALGLALPQLFSQIWVMTIQTEQYSQIVHQLHPPDFTKTMSYLVF